MDEGLGATTVEASGAGTLQGGLVSQVLANICLYYVKERLI